MINSGHYGNTNPPSEGMLVVLLLGATGLVGAKVLDRLLLNPKVRQVVAPTRRSLEFSHPKLLNPVLHFDTFSADFSWLNVDAVICALGTTKRLAGSREAFTKVDYEYPLAFAQAVKARGATSFVLTSATGANSNSLFFYNRVKGRLEKALQAQGFYSLTFVRPGLIGGKRNTLRLGEALAERLLKIVGPQLPRRWQISPADNIAEALVSAALACARGVHVVSAESLADA